MENSTRLLHTDNSDDISDEMIDNAILAHPLMGYIARAINDSKGEHMPYVPSREIWEHELNGNENVAITNQLTNVLKMLEIQATMAERIYDSAHNWGMTFLQTIMNGNGNNNLQHSKNSKSPTIRIKRERSNYNSTTSKKSSQNRSGTKRAANKVCFIFIVSLLFFFFFFLF